MRIGILTQGLHRNYGGLLQAFATQKILKRLGHQPLTLIIEYPKIERRGILWRMTVRPVWRAFRKLFLKPTVDSLIKGSKKMLEVATRNTSHFAQENISTTGKIMAPISEKDLEKYKFDAFVVGSDQVWRHEYTQSTFFLDFCGDNNDVRRVAFAASFGTDTWTFSPQETKIVSALAKKFHAVSVREDSGVKLCRKYLGVDAEHLVDPTMLLEKADYEKVIEDDEARGFLEPWDKTSRRVFSYILDESEGKTYVEDVVSGALDVTVERILPTVEELISGTPFPPVSAWLRGFRDAEFVVTDSFHGSVFSIIFNKPFLAIGNARRGMARFNSLLKMFGLENRLLLLPKITSNNLKRQILDIVHTVPDWQEINARREKEQLNSQEFLGKALKANGRPLGNTLKSNYLL